MRLTRLNFHRRERRPLLLLLLIALAAGAQSVAQQAASWPPVQLEVDASQIARRILRSRLIISVSPGSLTLVYPQWIPGEHGPTGPVTDVAGLKISAEGKPIPWRRDEVDMYAFHLQVPPTAKSIEVVFDFLSPPPSVGGFSSGASASAQLALISWNQLLLYPSGARPRELEYRARLRLPDGWQFGTALPVAAQSGEQIDFASVPLDTLIDSPVLCGANFRHEAIGPADGPPHFLEIAADEKSHLDFPTQWKAAFDRLVAETGLMFGARHYRSYRFLVSLSDQVAHFGLEHHESSDDRVAARALVDDDLRKLQASLFPHEFVHSWNGKYRRPEGLVTADYQQPMRTQLLWVYEGLTEYLGDVLAARSGFWTPDQYRENLARVAEWVQNQRGRSWAPLEDTTVAAQLRYNARSDWAAWRRGTDFYDEGELIWLEVDTIIRQQSGGRKSLDDFCRAFFGNSDTPPDVVSYSFDDLVKSLNGVVEYDWQSLLTERVKSVSPQAPLGGVERSGWKLVYSDSPSEMQRSREGQGNIGVTSSIGLSLSKEGSVIDVIPGKAADTAGIAPGMKLVSVNAQKWSSEVLRNAIAATRNGKASLELSLENGGFLRSYALNYSDGARYPRLEKDGSKPDLLSQIIKPLESSDK